MTAAATHLMLGCSLLLPYGCGACFERLGYRLISVVCPNRARVFFKKQANRERSDPISGQNWAPGRRPGEGREGAEEASGRGPMRVREGSEKCFKRLRDGIMSETGVSI